MLNKFFWLSGMGLVLLGLASCGEASKRPIAQQSPVVTANSPASPNRANPKPLANTKLGPAAAVRPAGGQLARVPGLIPSTDAENRLSQVSSGRRDPFATAVLPPVTVQPSAEGNSPPTLPLVTTTTNPLPIPIPGVLPPPPPLTVTVPYGQPVAAVPQPSPPTSTVVSSPAPVRTLRINGVVQVGNRFSAIVEDSLDQSTRSVAAGDYLGVDNLRVKQIRLGASREPVVVLERNGKEFIQSVGSPIPTSI